MTHNSRKAYQIQDWSKTYSALGYLLGDMPESGNMRFIRHAANIKFILLKEKRNGIYKFTDKQISTIEFALKR